MGATKHTPGPWTVGNGDELVIVAGRGVNIEHVATVSPSRRLQAGQPAADARLISAAPDLVEALEMCLLQMRATHPCDRSLADQIAIDKGAAALSRALGQEG